jgi:hypothetical protein
MTFLERLKNNQAPIYLKNNPAVYLKKHSHPIIKHSPSAGTGFILTDSQAILRLYLGRFQAFFAVLWNDNAQAFCLKPVSQASKQEANVISS